MFVEYEKKYKNYAEHKLHITIALHIGLENTLLAWTLKRQVDASRNFFQQDFNALVKVHHDLLGSSVDLDSSNIILLKRHGEFENDDLEEHITGFGIKEQGIEAIYDGISFHFLSLP
ncbi:hypothetical protein DITRI_Ditri03aG0097800 [Diplodiscus trichospermus]